MGTYAVDHEIELNFTEHFLSPRFLSSDFEHEW